MDKRAIRSLVLVSTVALLAAAEPKLDARWIRPGFERATFSKILVVGVTQTAARRHFEDKFVSHLRGRGFEGITSYAMVEDLTRIDAETRIVEEIRDQRIDAVLTVRLVPLKGRKTDEWHRGWMEWVGSEQRVRAFIEEALPVEQAKASRYGVEVTLWETANGTRIWAGRSDSFSQKLVKKGESGDFIQRVIIALQDERLI